MHFQLRISWRVFGFVLLGSASTWAADCNLNGTPDDQDIAAGTSDDCDGNGVPDECELWTQGEKLLASDASSGALFGTSVAIDADTLVVGALRDDEVASNAGAAYVFARVGTTWIQQAKLTGSDTERSHQLGRSVAISGDTIVLGTQISDGGGAAYVYERPALGPRQPESRLAVSAFSQARWGTNTPQTSHLEAHRRRR